LNKQISYFITGFFSIIPVVATVSILLYFIGLLNTILSFISQSSNPTFTIIASLLGLIIIYYFGRKVSKNEKISIINLLEYLLVKFPLMDDVLNTIKKFINMLQGKGEFEDLGVAKVPFAQGKTNGLITEIKERDDGSKEYTVFIVTGAFPPAGFICYYEEDQVEIRKDMTPKDVFQLQISLGIPHK